MKTIHPSTPLPSFRLFLIAFLGSGALLHAQDASWSGATSTDWNTGSNWSTSSVPTGVATFNLTGTRAISIGTPTSVGGLLLRSGTWTVSGSALTINNAAVSSGNRPIQVNTPITVTFLNQVVFNATAASGYGQLGISSSNSVLNFDGGISGNSSVTNFAFRTNATTVGGNGATASIKGDISNIATFQWASGNMILAISGSSSVSQETLISGNNITLQLGNNNALGSGTLHLNGGINTILQATGGARTYSNALNLHNGANNSGLGLLTVSGDYDLTFQGVTTVTNDTSITVVAGRRLQLLGGTISSKNISKDGAGTLVLGGALSHGNTTVTAGNLQIDGTLAYAKTPIVAVQGTGILSGTGIINRSVVFSDNGSGSGVLNPGDDLVNSGIGTLTVAGGDRSVTLANTTQLNFDLKSLALYDKLAITGDLTLDGVLNINDLGLTEGGSFKLITYSGTLVDNGLVLGTSLAGWDEAIRVDTATKSVWLDLTAVPEPGTYALLSGAAAFAWVLRRGKFGNGKIA